jgi:hypothetical protein
MGGSVDRVVNQGICSSSGYREDYDQEYIDASEK